MKLEAKHLAPYLPYDLQVEYRGKVTTLDALDSTGGAFVGGNRMVSFVDQRHIKPILRPLSSITKEEAYDLLSIAVFGERIDRDDIDNIDLVIENDCNIGVRGSFKGTLHGNSVFSLYVTYDSIIYTTTDEGIEEPMFTNLSIYEYLFANHFDVFGLIDKSFLAIDKTTFK